MQESFFTVYWVFVSISLSQLILMIGGLNARYLPLEILLFEFPVFSCLPWFHPSIHEADRREGSFSSIKREFSTLSHRKTNKTPGRKPVSLVGNQRVERSLISPWEQVQQSTFPYQILSIFACFFHSLSLSLLSFQSSGFRSSLLSLFSFSFSREASRLQSKGRILEMYSIGYEHSLATNRVWVIFGRKDESFLK